MSALALEAIGKKFGAVTALEHVDLVVAHGERHALIGPNGSGKSTLFNIISGALAPTRGRVVLDGAALRAGHPTATNRRGVGRSFQITRIFPNMSVRENIELAAMSRFGRRWSVLRIGAVWKEIRRTVDELLELSPLARHGTAHAGSLSYSDQRSLEICVTVATNPSVVLLDEPTAGMSREETSNIIAFIRNVTIDRTLLVVEHDMDVVFSLCDRVSVLANGRIIATDTPDAIRDNAAVQEAYLGVPVVGVPA